MKKISEKYNEACVKIFEMLKLLSKGTASYEEIIELFNEDEMNATAGAPVILNKYLNTLKIFGINIYKEKGIYHLQNSFFSFNLNKNDAKIFQLMKSTGELITNNRQRELYEKFINEIEIRLSSLSKDLLESETQDEENIKRNEYLIKYKELIAKCETYCLENQKLEITFKQEGKEYKVICNPREVTFINQKAYLSVFNHLSRQVFDIAADEILSIKQMPVVTNIPEIPVTVVYKIRNNLAKSYRLREWETTDGKFDENGWLTIINSNENFDVLSKRLMRYASNCVVVSPKTFKERMRTNIEETLANYQ